MKKVLILTYYFPPLGLGGTQRVAKFVKYLPQFGWQPTVVTVKPIVYWALDESLMKDVEGVEIIRTESFDPQRLLARFGRTTIRPSVGEKRASFIALINEKVLPYVVTPDSKILWSAFALRATKQLFAKEKFDVLLTTSPPHSVHLIGSKISKKYRLPWLADFRDGWAGSHVVHEPTVRHFKRNQKSQQAVVRSADAVTCISSAIQNSFNADEMADKFHIIANGYDPEDFNIAVSAKQDSFTLCYCGAINRFADPEQFLDALVLLKQRNPNEYEKLKVQFVGYDTLGNFQEMVDERGLNCVDIVGHKPHAQSVGYLKSADALLLIAKARPEDTFIPGKTFEYFGAQKPIFAISNSAPTNALLSETSPGTLISSFRVDDIYARLGEFLAADLHSKEINENYIRQFDRQVQTQQLSEILTHITKRS